MLLSLKKKEKLEKLLNLKQQEILKTLSLMLRDLLVESLLILMFKRMLNFGLSKLKVVMMENQSL